MNVKLFISVASNRDWKAKFGTALSNLRVHLRSPGIKGHNLEYHFLRAWGTASCLSIARQKFVDEMISEGYTHWLALDDDMTFPLDIVDRLIAHNKDLVAVNTRHKTTTAVKGCLMDVNGHRIDSTGKTGIEEICRVGGAIFLARIDAFKHIPRPHFEVRWIEETQDYMDCDFYFAYLLHKHGIKMYCDHDTTQLITHIGDYDYAFPQHQNE